MDRLSAEAWLCGMLCSALGAEVLLRAGETVAGWAMVALALGLLVLGALPRRPW